jgi:hypothetical protein
VESLWKFLLCRSWRGVFSDKIDLRTSFEEVLKGGPWFIGEHFLSLRLWTPNFRASAASVSSVAVWVRLPELLVEYCHKEALLRIGSGLGLVLCVDVNTTTGTRGRFARICIQLDLEKPLARTVRVGKAKLAVIYEGIGLLCFQCGKIGHHKEWYPCRVIEEAGNMSSDDQSMLCTKEEDKTKGFGPWMLVSRRKRQVNLVVVREPGTTLTVSNAGNGEQGCGVSQDKSRSTMTNHLKYSFLEKGKKAQAGGLRNKGLSEQTEPNISVSVDPIIKESSIQSSPSKLISNLKEKPSSSKVFQPPQAPITTSISLRPQVPNPKLGTLGHDKHSVGSVSDLQGTGELDDPIKGMEYSDQRGRNRVDSKGSASCVGMVRRRDGRAWSDIASAVQVTGYPDLPFLTDMVWLQEISPFWNFLTDVLRIDEINCPLRTRCQPSQEQRLV